MKTPKEVALMILEGGDNNHSIPKLPWDKNPRIGWWQDQKDHYTLYHGTHERNLHHIDKEGIHAPKQGSTAGNVSMTHDPYTAHGYASMSGSGGETSFRGVKGRPIHTPEHHRAVLVAHIPKDWAHQNMNHHMRGNVPETRDKLTNRNSYEQHAASGRPDYEHYSRTELRFKDHVPREFIKGYMKKVD